MTIGVYGVLDGGAPGGLGLPMVAVGAVLLGRELVADERPLDPDRATGPIRGGRPNGCTVASGAAAARRARRRGQRRRAAPVLRTVRSRSPPLPVLPVVGVLFAALPAFSRRRCRRTDRDPVRSRHVHLSRRRRAHAASTSISSFPRASSAWWSARPARASRRCCGPSTGSSPASPAAPRGARARRRASHRGPRPRARRPRRRRRPGPAGRVRHRHRRGRARLRDGEPRCGARP